MNRSILTLGLAALLTASLGTLHGGLAAGDDEDEGGDSSKIRIGRAIAPVPVNLRGRNPSLVWLGSYIVNAQGDCAGCHSNPQYAPGGNPHLGEPEVIPPDGYLRGGLPLFGPELLPRNLTPDGRGRPAGLTRDQFIQVMRTGVDLKNRPPAIPGPGHDLLQIMPWPVFSKMTTRDLRAVYEYLSAIPCLDPRGTGRCSG